MRSRLVEVHTGAQEVVHDLTGTCQDFLAEVGADSDGLLHVFVPHATAGLALIETGSGSEGDLLAVLERMLPGDFGWRHRHGAPGHGRDHVVPAFLRPDATVPVVGGELALGMWQRICLVDTNRDNRRRSVRLSFLAG